MSEVATNVSIVSSWEGDSIRACTISSLISVDISDPTVAFVLKKDSSTLKNIKYVSDFSISILSSNQKNFSEFYSKFRDENLRLNEAKHWETHKNGLPFLIGSQVNFFCKVSEIKVLQRAEVVFAQVLDSDESGSLNPLIYFRRRYFTIGNNQL
jgi:flavin reductase (DIM6/NTAB) family NADH-FMN oxidoreductase RutF